MNIEKETDPKYALYDSVVQTIMTNILIEHERCKKYIVSKFDQTDDTHKLYFNIVSVAADLTKENIYLDMPLLDYIKFRKKRRKKRSNLRWFNFFQRKRITEKIVEIDELMGFICSELNLNYRLYKEINDEYYGWYE